MCGQKRRSPSNGVRGQSSLRPSRATFVASSLASCKAVAYRCRAPPHSGPALKGSLIRPGGAASPLQGADHRCDSLGSSQASVPVHGCLPQHLQRRTGDEHDKETAAQHGARLSATRRPPAPAWPDRSIGTRHPVRVAHLIELGALRWQRCRVQRDGLAEFTFPPASYSCRLRLHSMGHDTALAT